MNFNLRRNTRSRPRPFRFSLRRNNIRKHFIAVKNVIKIAQALNSRKFITSIFAKQRHKTGIPYPYLSVTKRLIHIRCCRHTINMSNMIVSHFPRLVIQFIVIRHVLAYWLRQFLLPIELMIIKHYFSFKTKIVTFIISQLTINFNHK